MIKFGTCLRSFVCIIVRLTVAAIYNSALSVVCREAWQTTLYPFKWRSGTVKNAVQSSQNYSADTNNIDMILYSKKRLFSIQFDFHS